MTSPAPVIGLDLEVMAQLGAQVGRLTASLDRADQREAARLRRAAMNENQPISTPAFSFTSTQGLVTTTNPGFCPQAWGPNTGYFWAIQRITVAGLIAASAGAADGNVGTITAATAGNVSLPNATDLLTGFDIHLSTVGSAAMTVTLSNVTGGPYIYTILTGGSSLTITYPQPIPASGGAPKLAWSATAAAVGNASIYGLTAASAQDVLSIYKGTSPQGAQPQNAIDTLLGNNGYAQPVHIGTKGIILRPDESLIFAGTALAASTYYVNVDGIQVTSDKISEYVR